MSRGVFHIVKLEPHTGRELLEFHGRVHVFYSRDIASGWNVEWENWPSPGGIMLGSQPRSRECRYLGRFEERYPEHFRLDLYQVTASSELTVLTLEFHTKT